MEPAQEPAKVYLTLEEAARRISMKVNTLRNWIYMGRLTAANGLVRIGGSWRIDWPLFERTFVRRD